MQDRFYVHAGEDGQPRGLLVRRADFQDVVWNGSDQAWNRTGFIPGVTGDDDWDLVDVARAEQIARGLGIPWTWQQVSDDAPFLSL